MTDKKGTREVANTGCELRKEEIQNAVEGIKEKREGKAEIPSSSFKDDNSKTGGVMNVIRTSEYFVCCELCQRQQDSK